MKEKEELLVSGMVYRPTNLAELKKVLDKYNFDINKIDVETMTEEITDNIYFKNYYVGLDYRNEKIRQIGITNNANNFKEYYRNPHLNSAGSIILENVMTFAEASEIWGLGESTLRSAIKTNRFKENEDYKKSGKVWLITKEAMKRVYGELK